jgi:hypothetical protein
MQGFHTPSSKICFPFVVWLWFSRAGIHVLQQLHLMVIYLSGFFPHLETAEALDAHFEPVDWERSSHPEGIGSILPVSILRIFTLFAHVISGSYCMLFYSPDITCPLDGDPSFMFLTPKLKSFN